MSKVLSLYGGDVLLRFSETSHRYDVSTDGGQFWEVKQGVTTILGAVLNKPALMLWPLNEALKSLGAKMVCTDQEKQIWEWTIDGEVVVNTIKIQAAATAHRKKSDTGKDTGHLVHSMVENYLRYKLDGTISEPLDKDLRGAQASYKAFVRWFEKQKDIKVRGVEQIVYSKAYDVCGTYDCLLEIDGKTVLCDLKTTNISRDAPLGVYPEMMLQLGAYAQAYKEEARHMKTNDYDGDFETGKIDDLAIINAGKTGNLNVVFASELGLSVDQCINAWTDVLNTYKFLRPLQKQLKLRKA